MYRNTRAKSDEILMLYKEGVELTKICETTLSSQPTVKKVLKSHGIDYDSDRKEAYQLKLVKVIELYEQGKSQLYIEKELGLTRKTIRTLLKEKASSYRSKSEQHHIRYNTAINEQCFDELTPESMYWIGMLYTDGHVVKNREFSVSLTTHTQDAGHLGKFKEFLGTNRPVVNDHGDCKRLRINSKKIHTRLRELGLTHDKSYTAVPHHDLKHSRDFWRGVVDGDGGIYNYKQITLCSTLETIFEFIIFCSRSAGVNNKYPSKGSGDSLYQVHYYGEDAKKVANLLYKDATVYLDRKYEIYKDYFVT